jgi:cell division septum initiation protein DivIVA
MGLIVKDKYDQRKIDRLLDHLKIYFEKGRPIDFEIIVDGFKVVRRTSDIDMFQLYENHVDGDTKNVEILLFSGTSNSNDKHIFYLGNVPKESLNGIDVEDQIENGINQRLREQEFAKLQDKNKELEEEIKDLEKEVARLEKANETLEASQSPMNSVLGNLGSSLVEAFIKRNPKIMASIPGGSALAGLLDDSVAPPPAEDVEVSFKPKSSEESGAPHVLSDLDQQAIQFVNQLKAVFNKDEFDKINLILQSLAEEKSRFDKVIQILNIQIN